MSVMASGLSEAPLGPVGSVLKLACLLLDWVLVGVDEG